jgi:hypothetical protein
VRVQRLTDCVNIQDSDKVITNISVIAGIRPRDDFPVRERERERERESL